MTKRKPSWSVQRPPSSGPMWATLLVVVIVFLAAFALGSAGFLPAIGREVTLNFNVEIELGQLLLGIFAGGGILIAALTYRSTTRVLKDPPPDGAIPAPNETPDGPPISGLSKEQFMALTPDEMLWRIYDEGHAPAVNPYPPDEDQE